VSDFRDPAYRAAWAEASALTPVLDEPEPYRSRSPWRDAVLGWLVLVVLLGSQLLLAWWLA